MATSTPTASPTWHTTERPAEVEILFNEGSGRFGGGKKNQQRATPWKCPESLAVGDLDQDGRDDIALLAANDLVSFTRQLPGVFSEPVCVPHTASNPRLLKLLDLDGNGALDLVILDGGTDHPIHVRFATSEKKLGPEQRFQIECPRAIAFGQIDGKGGEEILTIENQSGRGRVLHARRIDYRRTEQVGPADLLRPFPGKRPRPGRWPLAISTATSGRMSWLPTRTTHRSGSIARAARSGLDAGQSFPGLLGGRIVHLADLDRDGKDEVYVLSEQEKQVGRASWRTADHLSAPLPITGEPVAMDLDDLDGDKIPELVYVAKRKPRKLALIRLILRALKRDASGNFKPTPGTARRTVNIAGLTRLPGQPGDDRRQSRRHHRHPDLHRVRLPVCCWAERAASPGFHRQPRPDGSRHPGRPEPDGPQAARRLIVAQNTFARHISLDPKVSGKSRTSSIRAGARPRSRRRGTRCRWRRHQRGRPARPHQPVAAFPRAARRALPPRRHALGRLDRVRGVHVADFDGDGRDDLLIAGSDRFGVSRPGARDSGSRR